MYRGLPVWENSKFGNVVELGNILPNSAILKQKIKTENTDLASDLTWGVMGNFLIPRQIFFFIAPKHVEWCIIKETSSTNMLIFLL